MYSSIDKILSPKSGLELKAIAIIVFGVIAVMTLFPYANGNTFRIEEEQIYIIVACAIGIAVVVMSDRITSLKIEKGALDIKLTDIKEELNDTIQQVKTSMPEHKGKMQQAEKLISKKQDSNDSDLLEEADDIGKAMKMLREVMASYKK